MKGKDLLERAQWVNPLGARRYAESHGWKLSTEVDETRYFLFTNPEWRLRQLLIPLAEDGEDYGQAILDVANRLAELEGRPVENVIEDLLLPGSDVLRFRIASKDTERGSLALPSAIGLIAGIKKALLSAACSVNHPKRHHPRMAWTEATEFVERCRLGQTEQGSFVVKVNCPLQLSQGFGRPMKEPFERRVTLILFRSCYTLAHAIDEDHAEALYSDYGDEAQISANLCEALLEIHYANQEANIGITAQWASAYPATVQKELTAPVVFTAEHFPAIDQIYKRLRFPRRSRQTKFTGIVAGLSGTIRAKGRPAGEVTVLVRHGDTNVHAKIALDTAEYELADKAHMSGRRIELNGVLHLGKRIHRIAEVTEFRIIDEAGASKR